MWHKLLSVEYLLEPIPGRPGPFRFFYLLLAAGTVGSLLLTAAWQRKPASRRCWQVLGPQMLLAAVAWSLLACAFAGVPYLSMRALVLGANSAALLYPVVSWVRQHERVDLWKRHHRALTGQMDVVQRMLPPGTCCLLAGLHMAGWVMLAEYEHWPVWVAALVLAGVLSPQLLFSLQARRWHVHLEGLAPLLLVYAVLLARLLLLLGAKLLLKYPHFILPTPWSQWLNVNVALVIALPWSVFVQVYAILRYQRRSEALLPGIAIAWLCLTSAWAAYTYVHHHTHGVTATDPYAYAQMAVDWAEHGLPVHHFPLVAEMQRLGVFAEAGVHLGYHLPFDGQGHAATVWPVGQAALLAIGYRLAGEPGLYLTTPALGLLSLVVLAALSQELFSRHPPGERWLISAVAVFLLATSYAQIERLVVPMADAAAQLFTTLMVLLWLRATRGQEGKNAPPGPFSPDMNRARYAAAFLSGLSFGVAYLVRHTQLVLAASVLWLAWVSRAERRQKASLLAWFAVGALLSGIPDLLYHQWIMGNPLRPESLELRHFSLAFMGRMAVQTVRDLLSAREFLYLSPFVLWGLVRQWRQEREHFGLLAIWAIAVLLIHLPYEALRLRDLLSLFPVLCLWAGYGVVEMGHTLALKHPRGLAYAACLIALLWLRTGTTLALPAAPDFDAFGHLNRAQRAGFARIGQSTEEMAWIGASLNTGSLELHSERTAFRPAVWLTEELYTFVDDALARGTPLYLLEDGLEMAAPVAAARKRYEMQWVGLYDIPFYHSGGGSVGGRVPLYRLQLRMNP